MFRSVLAHFRRPNGVSPAFMRRLYSAEQMQAALDRERARADRNGHVFSLLRFSLGSVVHPSRYEPLILVLQRRLRCTDEIGWLDRGQVGVILANTGSRDAFRVRDSVFSV